MTIEIYGEKTPRPQRVALRLRKHISGTIALSAVDADTGEVLPCGNLLFIDPATSEFKYAYAVNPDLGIKLKGDRILIKD